MIKHKPFRHIYLSWYEYLFPILNVCIGFANVLVFPAKVYEYRGGAYLIAYLFWIIMVGYPLVYLELIIGQYHRCSPIVFLRRCAPIFRGLGWMTVVSSLLILYNVQYSVARALKFVVALTRTRSNSMPWARCDNPWNTKYCYQFFSEECENLKEAHIMYQGQCVKDSELDPMMIVSAEKQYVENMIHSAGGSLMSFVNFDWGIFYAILLVWLSIAFVNNRGSFKGNFLVYIPAIAIFLICPFLLIRSLRLDGAGSGIREMFKIDWPQLLYSKIWIDALSNVIVSLGIGAGGHTVIASFAPYRKHTFTVATLAVFVDTMFSVIIAGTLFSTLGYIKFETGLNSVFDIPFLPDGIYLTHSTFPIFLRRVARNSWMWTFLYFSILVIVGWKTLAVSMKVLTVTIADVYGFSTTSFRYDFLGVVVSMIMAISGAFLCFESGPLYQNIIDDIQTLTCGLFLTAQLLIVIECYGIDQIYLDIYALMRPPGNWNRFYCLSMWSSRWRMAPAFTLIYAFLPFLLRTHSNMHNDVDYVYFYESLHVVVFLLLAFHMISSANYSRLKMKYYLKNVEKKPYSFRALCRLQKSLRSYSRIRFQMSEERKKWDDEHLPERDPEDKRGNWEQMYILADTELTEKEKKELMRNNRDSASH